MFNSTPFPCAPAWRLGHSRSHSSQPPC
jgi:hypothetical protein